MKTSLYITFLSFFFFLFTLAVISECIAVDECMLSFLMVPPAVCFQISIVELEKSQRQQELLQLKSYSPRDSSPYRKSLDSRGSTDMDSSRLGLSSAPALNGINPELSVNGTGSPCFDRANAKAELSRYLPISPDHDAVAAASEARQRQQSSSQPDYTRFSPAKIALRRHLNQDPTASAHLRGSGLMTHRWASPKSLHGVRKMSATFWIFLSVFFRELGGVNSPHGAKQNCPSPNSSDSQCNVKISDRVKN